MKNDINTLISKKEQLEIQEKLHSKNLFESPSKSGTGILDS